MELSFPHASYNQIFLIVFKKVYSWKLEGIKKINTIMYQRYQTAVVLGAALPLSTHIFPLLFRFEDL